MGDGASRSSFRRGRVLRVGGVPAQQQRGMEHRENKGRRLPRPPSIAEAKASRAAQALSLLRSMAAFVVLHAPVEGGEKKNTGSRGA